MEKKSVDLFRYEIDSDIFIQKFVTTDETSFTSISIKASVKRRKNRGLGPSQKRNGDKVHYGLLQSDGFCFVGPQGNIDSELLS